MGSVKRKHVRKFAILYETKNAIIFSKISFIKVNPINLGNPELKYLMLQQSLKSYSYHKHKSHFVTSDRYTYFHNIEYNHYLIGFQELTSFSLKSQIICHLLSWHKFNENLFENVCPLFKAFWKAFKKFSFLLWILK